MQKRLLWIVLVCVAVAIVGLLVFKPKERDSFDHWMTLGAGYLEKGEATNAIQAYSKAAEMVPESLAAQLNLANAELLAENSPETLAHCQQALNLDHNNPAAYYLMGCAYLRLNQPTNAVEAFQQSQKIDPAVTALNFQLGLAQDRAGNLDEAIHEFETVVQFEPEHPSAHYQLSRLYQRVGRDADAAQELAKHQQLQGKTAPAPGGIAAFERCKYTQPIVSFALEQPDRRGIPVHFTAATQEAFGVEAAAYHGPVGVLDYSHDGRNSLFVLQGNAFRLLDNTKGKFTAMGDAIPAVTNATYRACLVGDLNNDRVEDVVILGEQASHAFRFATNGQFREVTAASGLKNVKASDGLLADLDFTGKLDLLAVLPEAKGIRVYRNLGNGYFLDNTTNSGLPGVFEGAQHVAVEDWNNEDVPGVFITRAGKPPLFFAKQRAGAFVETNATANWPEANVLAVADLNNDLLLDCVLADDNQVQIIYGAGKQSVKLEAKGLQTKGVLLVDYDNDGWLDVLAYGKGIHAWRNLGKAGFEETTASLGLEKVGAVESILAADFDGDGDTDLVLSTAGGGLQYWRNDGGNANHQIKLLLVGNRSNPSALGVRVEVLAGRWRCIRTQERLPFEIGVGKHDKIDVLKTRWFDLATTLVDLPVQTQMLTLAELALPTGSCPYLYAWDGKGYRFVTDILGSAPLGLPVSATRYVDSDPEEFLSLGNDQSFPSKDGRYEVRLTEELREVLYLDTARLIAVDHPANTVVHPASKMVPNRPFPPHELWTLQPVSPLRQATRSDGSDVTAALAETDGNRVSPLRLREAQLRGLAEPFSITLDFGPLPVERPLVLVLNGWLRFGGGMANIGASLDASLPFPFPTLEAEAEDGSWKPVSVTVGVPAGKTKTILVDLDKKLAKGTRRLRLTMAFELYWDSASLCERASDGLNRTTTLLPERTDLHWHGFGPLSAACASEPLVPQYEHVVDTPPWRRTPSGWCTRYGPVDELVRDKDDALVLLNGGDELALSFRSDQLPPKPEKLVRDFFLYVVGWDKDADFHVGQGWRVEPLPFSGMDDQVYGRQAIPLAVRDSRMAKYNTRWVGSLVLAPVKSAFP